MFDAEKGLFLGKEYFSGNYQDQFADLIRGAVAVTVQFQPNLERDCKERLPERLLAYSLPREAVNLTAFLKNMSPLRCSAVSRMRRLSSSSD